MTSVVISSVFLTREMCSKRILCCRLVLLFDGSVAFFSEQEPFREYELILELDVLLFQLRKAEVFFHPLLRNDKCVN